MRPFERVLSGGHPNSLGRTPQVIEAVLADPRRLEHLFETLASADPTVRMRVADALEKVCREHPEWFDEHFADVLEMGRSEQPSLQWHAAQILAQMNLSPARRDRAIALLEKTADEATDWIVISETLTALSGFADEDPDVRARLLPRLRRRQDDPRQSVAKRASKLLAGLQAGGTS